MIKRLCLCLSIIMLICTLSGCKSVNEELVDKQSEDVSAVESVLSSETEMENAIESEATLFQSSESTVAEMVQAPERMVYEFENPGAMESSDGQVRIDAKIVIPNVKSMAVVPIIKKNITEEDVKTICEQFIGLNAVYGTEEWINKLIGFAEPYILATKEHYESQKEITPEDAWDELDKMSERNSWAAETLLFLLEQAKNQKEPNYKGYALNNTNNEVVELHFVCALDGDYIKCLLIVNDTVELICCNKNESDVIENIGISLRSYIDIHGYQGYVKNLRRQRSDSKNNDTLFGVTRQDVSNEFETLLLQYGFDNYIVDYTVRSGKEENSWITDPREMEYYLSNLFFTINSRQYYDGVSIFGGNYNNKILSGEATAWWYKDGWRNIIIEPTWTYEEPLVENVELLSFDRIETIVKASIDDDLKNADLDTSLAKGDISEIRLEYGLVHDKETDRDVIVPVWNFYQGGVMGEFGEIPTEDNYYYTNYMNVLTINAIDGSIMYIN